MVVVRVVDHQFAAHRPVPGIDRLEGSQPRAKQRELPEQRHGVPPVHQALVRHRPAFVAEPLEAFDDRAPPEPAHRDQDQDCEPGHRSALARLTSPSRHGHAQEGQGQTQAHDPGSGKAQKHRGGDEQAGERQQQMGVTPHPAQKLDDPLPQRPVGGWSSIVEGQGHDHRQDHAHQTGIVVPIHIGPERAAPTGEFPYPVDLPVGHEVLDQREEGQGRREGEYHGDGALQSRPLGE